MTLAFALIILGAVLLDSAITNRSVVDTALARQGDSLSKGGGSSGTPSQTAASPGQALATLSSAGDKAPGGSSTFDGHAVANWIIPALKWARSHGYWHGSVQSGVRTYAEQVTLYQRYLAGGNIAAKPGQSNHEKTHWPGGAVDVSDPEGLNAAMAHYPGVLKLKWGEPVIGDHPHFSATGR